jgi:hypothetical protein
MNLVVYNTSKELLHQTFFSISGTLGTFLVGESLELAFLDTGAVGWQHCPI